MTTRTRGMDQHFCTKLTGDQYGIMLIHTKTSHFGIRRGHLQTSRIVSKEQWSVKYPFSTFENLLLTKKICFPFWERVLRVGKAPFHGVNRNVSRIVYTDSRWSPMVLGDIYRIQTKSIFKKLSNSFILVLIVHRLVLF
ncbi:uncharacterized protein LOC135163806 [Diachasmimorpha longicaudata]|uniref:uncharacterized protein LOC135163806 n=1 Tax=Diachasmimorpha longicaudata TaxID=58733 RepID=UPI0030B8E5B5